MQIQVSNMLSDYYAIRSPSALGLYSGLAGLSVAAGTMIYRRYTSRLVTPTQLVVAFGLLGLSYVLMNYAPTPQLFTAWLIVNQIGSGMLLPPLVVSAMGSLPFAVRGRGTGIFMSGWWLGQPLSSQAVAFMRGQYHGNLPAALQILGILCLVAAVIALARRFLNAAPAEPQTV
jgi:MFS family permease